MRQKASSTAPAPFATLTGRSSGARSRCSCSARSTGWPHVHHEFIDDMASRTVYGREPTPRQHQYLHSLFFKLGGKITS